MYQPILLAQYYLHGWHRGLVAFLYRISSQKIYSGYLYKLDFLHFSEVLYWDSSFFELLVNKCVYEFIGQFQTRHLQRKGEQLYSDSLFFNIYNGYICVSQLVIVKMTDAQYINVVLSFVSTHFLFNIRVLKK